MSIPPPCAHESTARRRFAQLRTLQERLQDAFAPRKNFQELSMGMSQDYPWAVAEGATIVRVGSAIFGSRSN